MIKLQSSKWYLMINLETLITNDLIVSSIESDLFVY